MAISHTIEVDTYFAAACAQGVAVKRVANVGGLVSGAQATDKTVVGAEVPHGILCAAAGAGENGRVVQFGPAKAKAGAAITVGTHLWLTAAADGELIPAANGELVWGYFTGLADAADQDEIDVFVTLGQL